MPTAAGLANELTDLGKAIGLVKDDGELNSDWFNHPLDYLGSMLTGTQRAATLRMLDALLPPANLAGLPAGETWHPVLGDQPRGNVYITLNTAGAGVKFGVAADVGSAAGSAGITARLGIQCPLISSNGTLQ